MDPMEVRGGPFDFRVARKDNVISLSVIGKHGDTITEIDFAANKIDHLIDALRAMK